MEQVGEIWASLLETISSNRLDESLNEFMRFSNACSRAKEEDKIVVTELEKEGENRLTKALAVEIARISKQSIARSRNGDLTSAEADFFDCLRLLRIRIGVDLVSKFASSAKTTTECRQPIKQMLVVHLTVRCTQKRDELRAKLDLKKRTKNTVTSPDDGFLDAIEQCVTLIAEACKRCHDSESVLSSGNDNLSIGREGDGSGEASSSRASENLIIQEQFFTGLIGALHEAGAVHIRQMMEWFLEDRKIKSYWSARAAELGGLTLPRALHSDASVRKAPTPTPSPPPPPLQGTGARTQQRTMQAQALQTPREIKPLDNTESSNLDLLLHESSQILSLCAELQKGFLDDICIEIVSAMIPLDELWLTHNVTKAVSHAVSIEIEPPIWVNSIAEDTFHVVGTCFARAVNSHSYLATEAIANHVAGFISDGFFEILRELIKRDAPIGSTASSDTKASRAVASIGMDNVDDTRRMTFNGSSTLTPMYIEAINTLASACSYCADLKSEMKAAFQISFQRQEAPLIVDLDEVVQKMETLLEEAIRVLARVLLTQKALRVMNDALDPRGQPYELGVAAFERENIVRTSWIKEYVDAQFRQNIVLRECLPTLSHVPAGKLVETYCKAICDMFEERISRLRFTALGALQFDKDVRALCEAIVQDLNSTLLAQPLSSETAAASNVQLQQQFFVDYSRNFDAQVRSQFKRLRHWTFLLNLERASDHKEITFPGSALSDEQIQQVLKKRTEHDFFQ